MGPSVSCLGRAAGKHAAACVNLLFILGTVTWPASSLALDYRWASPVDGSWSVASNWLPVGVPVSQADSAYVPVSGAAFAIDLDLDASLRGVLLANPETVLELGGHVLATGASFFNHGVIVAGTGQTSTLWGSFSNTSSGTVQVEGGGVLQMYGGQWRNDGTIVVHLGEPAAAYLRPVSHLALVGAGRLVLQDSTLAIVDSPSGYVLTNGVGHTIEGAGTLSAPLVNHGLVAADRAGQWLLLNVYNKTNDGILEATAGGRLWLAGNSLMNTGGTVRADGGTVRLENISVVGGTLASGVGGAVVTVGTLVLVDLRNSGQLDILGGAVTALAGSSLVNEGVVQVHAGGGQIATMRMAGHVTVSGGGRIKLGDGALAAVDSPSGYGLTNAAEHQITGAGVISAPLNNHGLVSADLAGQDLVLSYYNKINDGTLQATAGGRLRITSMTVANTGGLVLADGGAVQFDNATISGGILDCVGGTMITAVGTVWLVDVTHSGRLEVGAGSVTGLAGTSLVNHGIIRVWDGGDDPAILRLGAHVTVTGSGAIELGDGAMARVDSPSGYGLTNAAGHGITGAGVISAPLTNHGLVSADLTGQDLVLSYYNKINDGTLRATAGGGLRISGIVVNNAGGVVFAAGGPVWLENGHVVGGTLTSGDGAAITTVGTATVNGVHNTGRLEIGNGSIMQLVGDAMVNDGDLLVHASGESASLIRMSGHVTVDGTGAFELNDPTRAGVDSPSGYWLTNGAEHTIRGAGVVSAPVVNNGEVCGDRDGEALVLTYYPKVNNGTFKAYDGGRLKLEVIPTNYNAGNHRLTGGAWLAEGGGVIELSGCPVDTNAAAIVLDGLGSRVDLDATGGSALAGLVRNAPEGSFTLRNDRDFTTAGGFVNAGLLVVGRASVLAVSGPSFSQTPGGTYRVELAGRDPQQYGVLAVLGQAAIAGTIAAEFVDGFTPAFGDSFVVLTFASRTGDFANVGPLEVEGMILTPVWRPHALVLHVTGAVGVDSDTLDAVPTRLNFAARRTRSGSSVLVLSLPEPAAVEVVVFDLAGRRVADVARGEEAAGVQEYPWPDSVGLSGRLASGVYLARALVSSGGKSVALVAKVLVVR